MEHWNNMKHRMNRKRKTSENNQNKRPFSLADNIHDHQKTIINIINYLFQKTAPSKRII